MKALHPIVLVLLTAAVLPGAAQAGDAEGCLDLKLFPRLEGCVIVECSAKKHDSLEAAGDGSGALNIDDASTNSIVYSCPLGDLQKMEHDFEGQLRKAGYLSVTEDKGDAANVGLTARKNSQWVHWNASTEDRATTYSLTTAGSASDKFKAEACGQQPVFSALKQCEVVECSSKAEDSVAMRTAQKGETSLTGNVQTLTLACPSLSAPQTFSTVEGELEASGFEILFSDREHPESGSITGRAGKRWVELVSAPDGESVSYALTVVPSAEVLTATTPEPTPVPTATLTAPPAPAMAPKPVQEPVLTAESAPAPVTPVSETISPPTTPPAPADTEAPAAATGFIPPKPIHQVPIQATHDRIYSVQGDVVINILVDVGQDGTVTRAELAGRVTKDVLALESAALDAVSHWRFEPARQDGRIVSAVKIPVQMHFHGRPWRF
jgi:periplasmic protein TonB